MQEAGLSTGLWRSGPGLLRGYFEAEAAGAEELVDFAEAAGSDFFAGVVPLPESEEDPDVEASEEESELLESDFEGAAGSDVLDAERLSLR